MSDEEHGGGASPSDSSQFVDESGSGDIFSVAVVHWNTRVFGKVINGRTKYDPRQEIESQTASRRCLTP